jgi:hypothetical protein
MLEDAEDQWRAMDQQTRDTVCAAVRLAQQRHQYDVLLAQVSAQTGMTTDEADRFYDQRC